MKLVVLLGNPGKTYEYTRHNAAWILCDKAFTDLEWEVDSYTTSMYAQTLVAGVPVVFAKPTTFMNLSGNAVRVLSKKFNTSLDDIIVVHDDIDYPIGEMKIARSRGAAHHNGVLSVMSVLGSEYTRIRIGIGSTERKSPVRDFVLQKFRPEELEILTSLSLAFADMVADVCTLGHVQAMNVWNTKRG
jgi:PTH1 family peptidyl-tRNA hydrolase